MQLLHTPQRQWHAFEWHKCTIEPTLKQHLWNWHSSNFEQEQDLWQFRGRCAFTDMNLWSSLRWCLFAREETYLKPSKIFRATIRDEENILWRRSRRKELNNQVWICGAGNRIDLICSISSPVRAMTNPSLQRSTRTIAKMLVTLWGVLQTARPRDLKKM